MNIDESTGTRHRVKVHGDNYYVSIFPETKEIFVSSEHLTGDQDLTARLISKLWQSKGIDECREQLSRSSMISNDFSGVLFRVLESVKNP